MTSTTETETKKSNPVSRTITIVLASLCVFAALASIGFAVQFLMVTDSTNQLAEKTQSIRGLQIGGQTTSPPPMRLQVQESDLSQTQQALKDFPLTQQMLKGGIESYPAGSHPSTVAIVSRLTAAELSGSEINILLDKLQTADTIHLRGRRIAQDVLAPLARRPGVDRARLKTAMAKFGGHMPQTTSRTPVGKYVTFDSGFRSRSLRVAPLPPAGNANPERDFTRSVLAAFRPELTQAPAAAGAKADPGPTDAKDPLTALVAALGHLSDPTHSKLKSYFNLPADDVLRVRVASLTNEQLKDLIHAEDSESREKGYPLWYMWLAVCWSDHAMLDRLWEIRGLDNASSIDVEKFMDGAAFAAARHDSKWFETLLAYADVPQIAASLNSLEKNGWVLLRNLAVCAERAPQSLLLKKVQDEELAGRLCRVGLGNIRHWEDATIQAILGLVKSNYIASTTPWVLTMDADEDSRQRITQAILDLKDESDRNAAIRALSHLIDPWAFKEVVVENYRKAHERGELGQLLLEEVPKNPNQSINQIALTLTDPKNADHPDDGKQLIAAAKQQLYVELDALLSSCLLRNEIGSGTAFLDVASKFGGAATATIMSTELKEVKAGLVEAKWPVEDLTRTIAEISAAVAQRKEGA